jgi:chromosome segregation ATPase
MWPKALAQLVELAPHITRLAPLADRFLKDKAAGDEATRQVLDNQRAALEAHRASVADLGTGLRTELGALTSAQTTQSTHIAQLAKQVGEFEKHLVTTRTDALAAKQAAESLDQRLRSIEATQKRAQGLAVVAVGLLLAILALIATLFLRAR